MTSFAFGKRIPTTDQSKGRDLSARPSITEKG